MLSRCVSHDYEREWLLFLSTWHRSQHTEFCMCSCLVFTTARAWSIVSLFRMSRRRLAEIKEFAQR